MHEYSLVQSMMDKIAEEARSHDATSVHRVQVRIGRLSGVEADLFATAYEVLRPGTVCAAAELVLLREEGEWRCDVCGHVLPPEGVLTCPSCDWPARLARGGDLILERIEMDVRDV
jgi:hydrogenase nickel incorporation protein HypA/HybF